MKKVLALILALIMSLSLVACGAKETPAPEKEEAPKQEATTEAPAAADALVIRLAHVVADGSSLDQGLDEFARIVGEKSNGSIKVELYPNSTLGDNTALAEQLQFGSLEMACPSIAAVSGFCKATAIFDMPFLFKNTDAAEEALDESDLGKTVAAGLEESGFHVMGYFTQGQRHLTCNVEARGPEAMKGIKIRTMDSKYHMMAWNSMGASATPMAFSEVYTALQQGTIDAQENPYTNIVTSRFYEVQDYIVETAHIYDVCPLLYSKALWDTLTDDQKAILEEATKEALPIARQIVVDNTDGERQQVVDAGTTIVNLTVEERESFRQAAMPCYDDYKAAYGEEATRLLAIVDEVNAKH